ncbi:MAG: glycosyltransferase family 2 protein [Rhodospirillales bacterium]|nr:glycosyltransferase family 2 protein [Rhodospirillales bacterium]
MSPAQADPWSRVAVVTVTHHSAALIEKCLASVARAAQVIVVDNASDDDTPTMVRRASTKAQVIANSVNRGFGAGCNQGLEKIAVEFALLLGPDSTIDDASLAALVDAADRWPEAGLLGPAIIAPDGHVELSHDLGLFERIAAGRRLDGNLVPGGPLCANHLSGAVLLVRMSALQQVGGFDSNIFLYYEDDDLCIRMRRAGHSLILVPEARATHIGGGASRPGLGIHWRKFWHMAWSRLYIEAKYHGRPATVRVAVRHAPRFLAKALGYALVLNGRKGVRDAARFAGTVAWILGVKAMPEMPLAPGS